MYDGLDFQVQEYIHHHLQLCRAGRDGAEPDNELRGQLPRWTDEPQGVYPQPTACQVLHTMRPTPHSTHHHGTPHHGG